MKLEKLERFLDDIAYICGLVMISFDKYLATGTKDQRTEKIVRKKLSKKLWMEVRAEQAQKAQIVRRFSKLKTKKKSSLRAIEKNFDDIITEDPNVER